MRYKSCGLRSVNIDRIEALVWDKVTNSGHYLAQIQSDWYDTGNAAALKISDSDIVSLKKELKIFEGRDKNLLDLYELGRIDIDVYDKRKREIEKELLTITTKLHNEEQRNLSLTNLKNNTEHLFEGLKGLWSIHKELNKLSLADKRQLLHQLDTNIIVKWNSEKRSHEIELTFSVNGFNYIKKDKIDSTEAQKPYRHLKPKADVKNEKFVESLFYSTLFSTGLHITAPHH
jgi:hypothetical protein